MNRDELKAFAEKEVGAAEAYVAASPRLAWFLYGAGSVAILWFLSWISG